MYNVSSLKKTHIRKRPEAEHFVCLIMNDFNFIMLIFPIAFRIFKYIHDTP